MGHPSFLVTSPSHWCDPTIPIAAIRAGEAGILDLGICHPDYLRRLQVERLVSQGGRRAWGLQLRFTWRLRAARQPLSPPESGRSRTEVVPILVIAGGPGDRRI